MDQQHRFNLLSFPRLILIEIISQLDYESKFQLAQSSTRVRKFIESFKVFYDSVEINLDQDIMLIRIVNGTQHSLTACNRTSDRKTKFIRISNRTVTERTYPRSFMTVFMQQLRMVLWCPKTSINSLKILDDGKLVGYDNKNCHRLLRRMLKSLNLHLKVQKFCMISSDNLKLAAFLSALEAENLTTIKIYAPVRMELRRTVDLPQWRGATTINTSGKIELDLKTIMKTPNIRTQCSLGLAQFKNLGKFILESSSFKSLELIDYLYDEQGIIGTTIPFAKDEHSNMHKYIGDGFSVTAEIVVEDNTSTLIVKKHYNVFAN